MHEVKNRSGENSFGKLEKRLYKKPHQSNKYYYRSKSGIFYKYAEGKMPIESPRLVNSIENEFPGTKLILNHPLWFILENPSSDLETVRNQMRFLNTDIQAQLFTKNNQENPYLRKEWSNTRPFHYIAMQNNMDALACFLMIIREMEISKKWHTYTVAKWFAHQLYLRLAYFTPIKEVTDELYKFIYVLYIGRNNPLPKKFNKLFPEKYYIAPSFVNTTLFISEKLSSILWNAQYHGFKEPDKHSQLRFLFWAFTLGLQETHDSLHSSNSTHESQIFIGKLMSAYKSTSPRDHIPNGLL